MRFKRSEGLTPSERILADLCDNSFLKLWTYPNLYHKPAKELADLIVVFGNDVLIFSDKSCELSDSGDLAVDWPRWYRKSIANSAKQVSGAERWLREHPNRVFLDSACTTPIPIATPAAGDMRIHRICVALGSAERAQAETGRRGLTISTTVQNDTQPFTVGRIAEAKGWVHVFDEESLKIVLRELTTAADFVHYLNAKIALFDEGRFQFAESELDIMAYYLWNNRSFPPSDGPYRLDPKLWPKVEADEAFLRGRAENEIRVFWDRLIEHLTGHYLAETLEFGNDLAMLDYERIVRIMAGETRFFRRILSSHILDRADRARRHAISTLLESGQPDVNYVLYIGKGAPRAEYPAYREDRGLVLRSRCIAAKAVKPDKRYIVGMALDARGVEGSSEDFLLMDTRAWSAEAISKAEQLRQELRYFVPGRTIDTPVHVDEYPAAWKASHE
ncbi:MAG: hypothetical protein EOQ98_06645 [Mesorhizobium sp.]|uniref:hypothetical protein n=1 Tax=Mesorhizobium sp. TaxID=1871066 RepID=UPI000FE95693|nr:hypothetical protein [Mesorhizobium sp.]RWP01363.1 MAG: hypothetical protein EOQ98_06645 [Mesorhizobium sp.]